MRWSHLPLVMAVLIIVSSCSKEPFHPGETNRAKSAAVQQAIEACARAAGWGFEDLQVLVDDDDRLIRIQYRAQPISPAPPRSESEVADSCLAEANVEMPSG